LKDQKITSKLDQAPLIPTKEI